MYIYLNNSYCPNKQLGNILLELMIASFFGLLVISFIFELYFSIKKNFDFQIEFNQIQNNAKTAIDIISSEIHQAGYIGCAHLFSDFPIEGYKNYTITPWNKLIISNEEVTVRHASTNSVELSQPMNHFSILKAQSSIKFKKNNILIVSDCKHAEIFKVNNISYENGLQIIKPSISLHTLYDAHAEIARFEINHFYVKNSALYLENINRSKIKMVGGINALRFRYDSSEPEMNKIVIDIQAGEHLFNKIWHRYVLLSK